ncbi:hypothetical protein AAFF_G00066360 [Aldrovandia affinis]|uniref:Uncharacterized protein n=1 Tax=Aldrovandia affinis TaxID=143900 RepID=A0AAD7T484_9TELE|nr:hypothetical protein AAFF_G00066360 [Aldrovandia affinis]
MEYEHTPPSSCENLGRLPVIYDFSQKTKYSHFHNRDFKTEGRTCTPSGIRQEVSAFPPPTPPLPARTDRPTGSVEIPRHYRYRAAAGGVGETKRTGGVGVGDLRVTVD